MGCNVLCSRSIYPRSILDEADEPNSLVDLPDAEPLRGSAVFLSVLRGRDDRGRHGLCFWRAGADRRAAGAPECGLLRLRLTIKLATWLGSWLGSARAGASGRWVLEAMLLVAVTSAYWRKLLRIFYPTRCWLKQRTGCHHVRRFGALFKGSVDGC
jgi:hypothetical protein